MNERASRFAIALAIFALAIAISPQLQTANAAVGDGKQIITLCRTNLTGTLRQITSGTCTALTETTVTLRVGPEAGTEFPFICNNCALYNQSIFQGRDLTGGLLMGAQFTNDPLGDTNFTQAQLAGANFMNTSLAGANFTNADLSAADFTGATGMASSTVTGVTWGSTICPDATNSDDHGGTCVGHF